MKNNPEEIPSNVFDWLEAHDFQQLTSGQQEVVLQFFSPEEYSDMHLAACRLRAEAHANSSSGKERKKQELLRHFDSLYPKAEPKVHQLYAPLLWWRAAAIALLMASFGLTYGLMNRKKSDSTLIVNKTDTLYVVKEVASAPLKLYDTVFIHLTNKQKPSVTDYDTVLAVNEPRRDTGMRNSPFLESPAVLSIHERESLSNQPKHNSMKDDTLLRKYSFVTM